MNPNDFHDKAHTYYRCTEAQEAACFCEPFPAPWGGYMHRPAAWYLFWCHGEQGPRTVWQTERNNEDEAREMAEKLGFDG